MRQASKDNGKVLPHTVRIISDALESLGRVSGFVALISVSTRRNTGRTTGDQGPFKMHICPETNEGIYLHFYECIQLLRSINLDLCHVWCEGRNVEVVIAVFGHYGPGT